MRAVGGILSGCHIPLLSHVRTDAEQAAVTTGTGRILHRDIDIAFYVDGRGAGLAVFASADSGSILADVKASLLSTGSIVCNQMIAGGRNVNPVTRGIHGR